jgi:hypothetical protein
LDTVDISQYEMSSGKLFSGEKSLENKGN